MFDHSSRQNPFENIDIDSSLEHFKNMPKKDLKKLCRKSRNSDIIRKLNEINKREKSSRRKLWWKDNWISLLGLVFSFIAALPVIIEAIASILQHIM